MKYIAAVIHNQSLGCVMAFETIEAAQHQVLMWYLFKAGPSLSKEYIVDLIASEIHDFYFKEDEDNEYTYSVGIVE